MILIPLQKTNQNRIVRTQELMSSDPSFVPNLEAEIGLALMFASMIPTLPWARLFPFAIFVALGAVTIAWWGFLAWLIWHWAQSPG
jgi:hypothetical protein